MKDRYGTKLRNGVQVQISANACRKYELKTNFGTVVNANHNPQQLVTVELANGGNVDLHSKSLIADK